MKQFVEPVRRLLGGAAFWAVVLLVLPNCAPFEGTSSPASNFGAGPLPRDAAIFCDIEKERHCATDQDLAGGIRLTAAAVALNTGRTSNIGLDYSPEAMERCPTPTGGRLPQAVVFHGPFPDGLPVCLNCGAVIGPTYPTDDEACRVKCYDLYGTTTADGTLVPGVPPTDATRNHCNANTRVSTNVGGCVGGACPAEGGDVRDDFIDPRRTPDAVQWQDTIGTTAGPGGTLTRTAATTGNYDAGAVSVQRFTKGDGYVEFGVDSSTQSHVLGLSQVPAGCPHPCADTSQDYRTIGYAFVLGFDGRIYIALNGRFMTGPVDGAFGTYTAVDRFRVTVTAKTANSATIAFGRIIGSCAPGMPCAMLPLYAADETAQATYPLRVDTSFLDQDSDLTDVRMVYIK